MCVSVYTICRSAWTRHKGTSHLPPSCHKICMCLYIIPPSSWFYTTWGSATGSSRRWSVRKLWPSAGSSTTTVGSSMLTWGESWTSRNFVKSSPHGAEDIITDILCLWPVVSVEFLKNKVLTAPSPAHTCGGETDTEEVTVYVNGTAAEQKQPNKSDYLCIT